MIRFRRCIVFFMLVFLLGNFLFIENIFAAKKKSKSSKRRSAASSRSSRRRSAVSSRSSKRRSAASRRSARSSRSINSRLTRLDIPESKIENNNTSSNSTIVNESSRTEVMCPVNKVLRKDSENDETNIYYYKKQICIAPSVSEEHNLNSNTNLEQQLGIVKPNWIEDESEAVYLTCPNNYVLSDKYSWEHILKKEKIDTFENNPPCINVNKFCPLNSPVEIRGNDLFNSDGMKCIKIKNGILKRPEDEETNSTSVAFMICDKGFYPLRFAEKPAKLAINAKDSKVFVQPVISCIRCPMGYTSDGSVCTKIPTILDCKEGEFFEENEKECKVCPKGFWCSKGIQNNCPADKEYSEPGAVKEEDCKHIITIKDCKPGEYFEDNKCNDCSIGSWCADGIKHECPEDKNFSKAKSSSESACKHIPTMDECKVNEYFEDNKCNVCPDGYWCKKGEKKDCPAGSWCKDGVKHYCPSDRKISEPNSSSESECENITTMENCPDGSFFENDNCNICPAGSWCKDGVVTECPFGYESEAGLSECKKIKVHKNNNIRDRDHNSIFDRMRKHNSSNNTGLKNNNSSKDSSDKNNFMNEINNTVKRIAKEATKEAKQKVKQEQKEQKRQEKEQRKKEKKELQKSYKDEMTKSKVAYKERMNKINKDKKEAMKKMEKFGFDKKTEKKVKKEINKAVKAEKKAAKKEKKEREKAAKKERKERRSRSKKSK